MKTLLYKLSEYVPLAWLMRAAHGGTLVGLYHVISDEVRPHTESIYNAKNVVEFEADIEYLLRHFRPIDLGHLKSQIEMGEKPNKPMFFLTFDDGLRETAESVIPILKRQGLSAAFFVSSAFLDNEDMSYRLKASILVSIIRKKTMTRSVIEAIRESIENAGYRLTGDLAASLLSVSHQQLLILDKIADIVEFDFHDYLRHVRPYMSTEQMRALVRDGFVVGSHSVSHPPYGGLSLKEQLCETRDGLSALIDRIGHVERIFAFPFSESGVGADFFERILADGTVELIFGTSGWRHIPDMRFVQRVVLDGKSQAPVILRKSLVHELLSRIRYNRSSKNSA